ncbi:MAG: PilZ domain-containing protein [Deltaproteobacteria bacterium]|nr:MAG: PilZ domain-containing protein [Deltaproteobacteria bacterium]
MAVEIERQLYARAEVNWPVTMTTAQGHVEGEARNISPGGVYIHCKSPPAENEVFRVKITPPDRLPLEASVEVVWIDMQTASDETTVPNGMGVRFVEISEEDRQYLLDLVFDLKELDD